MWRAERISNSLSRVHYRAIPDAFFKYPTKNREVVRAEDLTDTILELFYVLYLVHEHTSAAYALTDNAGNSFWTTESDLSPGDTEDEKKLTFKLITNTVSNARNIELKINQQDVDGVLFWGTTTTDNTLQSLKPFVFDAIRAAVTLKTGPMQQFDGNDLVGFKLYVSTHHSAADPYLYLHDNGNYALWYKPPTGDTNPTKSGDCVNMQSYTNWLNRESVEGKMGMSFAIENGRHVVKTIIYEDGVVDRVDDNLLPIYEAAIQQMANIVTNDGKTYRFNGNEFVADLCWIHRYLPRIYGEFDAFLSGTTGGFNVTFTPPSVVAQLFPGDTIDAGGLKRAFVTRLMEATAGKNNFVRTDEAEFVSRNLLALPHGASFVEKESQTLNADEQTIFRGLGSFIRFIRFSQQQAGGMHWLALGSVFSSLFYEYACCTADIDKVNVLVNSCGKDYEKSAMEFVMTKSCGDVANLEEYSEMHTYLSSFLDEADEEFLPSDMNWSEFWTEEKWSAAKLLIVRFFRVLYRKYTLVFDATKAAMLRGSSIRQVYDIETLTRYGSQGLPLDVYRFLNNLPPHLSNINFKTSSELDSESTMDCKRGVSLLILAGVLMYLHNGSQATVFSHFDEHEPPTSGRRHKWQAKVEVESLRVVKYYPRHSAPIFYYAKGAYQVVHRLAEVLKNRVQGELNRQRIVDDMRVANALPNVKQWLSDLVLTSPREEVERFLMVVTGSNRLLPGQHIEVTVGTVLYPHTCFKRLDVPTSFETNTREFFMSALL